MSADTVPSDKHYQPQHLLWEIGTFTVGSSLCQRSAPLGGSPSASSVLTAIFAGVQLGAGDEHIICGKTVRVNRAGPRPALHLLSASEAGRSQTTPPTCSAPLAGGVSRQRGGHSSSNPISLPGLGMQSAATPTLCTTNQSARSMQPAATALQWKTNQSARSMQPTATALQWKSIL